MGVRGSNGPTFIDVSAFQCKILDVYRGLRCQESFSCRAPLRFCQGKSIWSYVYQCFSDCIVIDTRSAGQLHFAYGSRVHFGSQSGSYQACLRFVQKLSFFERWMKIMKSQSG